MIPKGIGFWDKERGIKPTRQAKWGRAGIRFERSKLGIPELSIHPHGIGGAVTGKHYTRMIFDDIIGEKSPNSPAVMADAVHFIDHSRPLERPANNGCQLFNYTPWAYADVYAHVLKTWKGEYKVYRRHLLEDEDGKPTINGKSIFPGKVSTKMARRMHKTNAFVFWSQFMCIPKAGKTLDFSEDWFHFGSITYTGSDPVFQIDKTHYNPDVYDLESTADEDNPPPRLIPLSWMSKAIIFDPIPGKESELRKEPNCKHGIVVVGKDPWSRRFCLEARYSSVNETEVSKELIELSHKWGAEYIGVEDVGFSCLYVPLIQMIADRDYEGRCPQLYGCETGGRQKEQRVREELAPTHQNHFWYYNRQGTQPIIQELTEFPHSEFKDCEDALAYTDQILQRPETPEEARLAWYSDMRKTQDRGLTGYGRFFE